MKNKFKKLISLVLIFIISVSNITLICASDITVTQTIEEEPEEVINETSEDASNLKGAAALTTFLKGSPFLTSSWEKQKLDREDMIAMSMYMSSYTYPLIDNYKTTFYTEEQYGQKGKSYDKLIFQDENKQIAIQDFLNTIIANQSPIEQDIVQVSEERKLRDADLESDATNEGITLQEFLFGEDSLELEDFSEEDIKQIIINPTFSQKKYEIGASNKRVIIYDGTSTKQRNLLYLSILRTFNSEYRLNLFNNLKSFLNCQVFVDNFGNICINGLDNEIGSSESSLYIDENDEVISTSLDETNELYYPVSNIIVLPNCMNSQIIGKLNLYSPYFLNNSLVSTSKMEGIYIADADYPTSKQNKFNAVNNIEIGYQQIDLNKSEEENEKIIVNDVEDEESSVLYKYSVSNDLIYTYYDISGMTPILNQIFYEKNAPAKYFSSTINLNNLPVTKGYALNKKYNINYYAPRMLYFNYLLMSREFFDSRKQVNSDVYFTDDSLGTEEIASSLFIDQNRKIEELVTDLYEKTQDPSKKIDDYFTIITSILIRVYETLVSIPFGSSYINNIPILSTLYSFLQQNYMLIVVIAIGLITFFGISKGSLLRSIVKGICCIVLLVSIPSIYDNAINVISTLKYSLLEKGINHWILSENSKYKGIEDISNPANYVETVANTTKPEELDNTLLYIKSKSPVIINNISEDKVNEMKGSTVGSQIINNILANHIYTENKTSSFQDLFKRWEMIIPVWDYASREVTKSLQIEGSKDSNKFINKLSSLDENENYFTNYTDLTEHRQELEGFFSGYEPTIGTETYQSFASREDFENVILETRYKRKFTAEELTQMKINNDSQEELSGNDLLTNYTLPLGIKGNFSIHNNFYYLDDVFVETENKYKNDINKVSVDGLTTNLSTYFPTKEEKESVVQDYSINNFNFYDNSKYDHNYGYFTLTENVSPYFYTVWYDMLGNLTSREIGYALAGQMNKDEDNDSIQYTKIDGVTVDSRDSILLKESSIIDYLDLKELFTNVIPYMNAVSLGAKKSFSNTLSLDKRYNYYKNNKVYWLYEAQWAEEIIKNYGKYLGENTVFSEREIAEKEINRELTDFENLVQQFYIELTPLLEELYDVADRNEVDKAVLIRQMTILSTLKFNSIFGVLGTNLQPKQIITESLPFDSLWVKFLRDNNYENIGNNFLDMISRQKSINQAFINVMCAFILSISYYYCIIVLLITTTLSFLTIFIKAMKNSTDPDADYFPFIVGCIILIFKIAFLYIVPQFVIQISLSNNIITDTKTDPIFIYLIYTFIYIFISKSVIPNLLSPHVGKIKAFGLFNPINGEDDLGGSKLIQKIGSSLGNIGRTAVRVATGTNNANSINSTPIKRMVPSTAFKREEINNNKKSTNTNNFRTYRAATANSSYQESYNNKAIADINRAIEADKKSGNATKLTPTVKFDNK